MKRDSAFTGLEAAIVLIAFVVVAAIFSYVMLGAGFFATQKAQEVTYSGIKQATSNVVFDGSLYGNISTNQLVGFTFNVRVPEGGQSVDMAHTIFTYTSTKVIPPVVLKEGTVNDGNVGVVFTYPTTAFTYNVYYPENKENPGVANHILSPGSFATYLVTVEGVDFGDWFTLEMTPRIGAPTQITKTLSAGQQDGELLL
jgi:flagellin FlaB